MVRYGEEIRLDGRKTVVERDANGRFVKGNGGGPGRPPKQREQRYYEIALNACTFKDWRIIWKKAIEQAKDGDKDARKFVADYLIGKPPQKLEHTGADGSPLIPVKEIIVKLNEPVED